MERVLAPVALITLLLLLWETVCRAARIPAFLLPPPSQVAAALVEGAPSLALAAWRTLSMALLALAAASLFASSVGLFVSLDRTVENAVRPLAVGLQVTPVVAIAPLFVIWAGIDHPGRAIVALAAIVAFFPIYSGVVTGLKSADPDLERLFDLYGAGPMQRLLRLRMPAAVPAMLEGHKVAAGLAVIGAVVAEFVAGSGGAQGLAWRILEAGNRLQTARMFAAIIVLAVMAGLLHFAFQALEARALVWWRGR
ncbi:MAG TPA: ABC transporter permease [Caulobacteraceae bacterium]